MPTRNPNATYRYRKRAGEAGEDEPQSDQRSPDGGRNPRPDPILGSATPTTKESAKVTIAIEKTHPISVRLQPNSSARGLTNVLQA